MINLKRYTCLFLFATLINLYPLMAHASLWGAMAGLLQAQLREMERQGILQQALPDIRALNQQSLWQLQQQVAALTGNRGYGSLYFNSDLQSWGANTQTWETLLRSYQSGGLAHELGGIAKQMAEQFPIQKALVPNFPLNATNATYYALQAETALATRAASQLTYDNLQQEMDDQHQLQRHIDQTRTVKDSIDLQNRLQVENNLLQLELVRLLALSNQQQAVQAQNDSNSLVANAQFLQWEK